ncbi:hypothetical protein F2Q69_00015300 [Brassica cretica]|uniref:Uncharacterized protein n=1 Tax=Brassica cretica TaxID=69181 RepID=A0A8S9QUR7_BRACR|nr:hypothetical protein F2Q69_00015300 [Brassica cretica]
MARKTGSTIATRLDALTTALITRSDPQIQHVFHAPPPPAQQQVCPHQQLMCHQNQIDDARAQVIQLDDDEVDESFIEDIARTTDYGDNWAFKNSDPIHHRDTWIYNHSLSWQLRVLHIYIPSTSDWIPYWSSQLNILPRESVYRIIYHIGVSRCYDGARTSRNIAENFPVMKRQSGDRENRKLHVIHLSKLSPSCLVMCGAIRERDLRSVIPFYFPSHVSLERRRVPFSVLFKPSVLSSES